MGKHTMRDIALSVVCAAIAAYSFASLAGVNFAPWVDRVGMLLIAIVLLSLALFGPKLIEPSRGTEK